MIKKKSEQPSWKKTFNRAAVCLLSAVLVCSLCAVPALAMGAGEAGITPDPPTTIVDPDPQPDPIQPDPQPEPGPEPTPDPPASSMPSSPSSTPEQPDPGSSSSPVSSGGESSRVSMPESSSASSSSTSSRTSRPWTSSSRVTSYSDPDPRESYVEYIPPNNNGNQNNHTTSAENPVAVAPVESNTELLSSQDWAALLSTPSQPGDGSELTSALPPVAGGIFSQKEDARGVSIVLILGIVMLVLGTAGVAFFIYSQFIYKHRKAKKEASTDEYYYDDPNGYHDGYQKSEIPKGNTEPLPYVPTERDISSFSDPHMKPPNPLKQPEPPPKRTHRVEVEDIDWDQFFKDNK